MRHIATITVFTALVFVGCNKSNPQTIIQKQSEIEGGKLDVSYTYTAEEIGWKTMIPSDWEVMTKDTSQKLNESGMKLLEKTTDAPFDVSGLKQMLNLKKNELNNFMSTINPYDEAKYGNWMNGQTEQMNVMKKAYEVAGVKLGESKQGKKTLDGLEFQTIEFEIKHPRTGNILATQKMFTRLIHGYDFSMTITTSNDADRNTLLKVIESSTFSKRD